MTPSLQKLTKDPVAGMEVIVNQEHAHQAVPVSEQLHDEEAVKCERVMDSGEVPFLLDMSIAATKETSAATAKTGTTSCSTTNTSEQEETDIHSDQSHTTGQEKLDVTNTIHTEKGFTVTMEESHVPVKSTSSECVKEAVRESEVCAGSDASSAFQMKEQRKKR